MDLIAIKEIGVELPQQKNIDNCIKYNKTYSVSFARDGIITVVRELKSDDYETLIDYYNLSKDDAIMFCFQGYSANDLGDMPLVISKSNKKFKEKTFVTNKSIIAFSDSVLGVGKEESIIDEFIGNIAKFDRKNFSDITKLVFGDNLVAVLNADGSFETYGLELTSAKKWKKGTSGILYTDDDYNSKTYYNNNYYSNSSYYGGMYGDYNYYDDYEYQDNNPTPYKCDVCNKKHSFIVVKGNKNLCHKCYKNQKSEVCK